MAKPLGVQLDSYTKKLEEVGAAKSIRKKYQVMFYLSCFIKEQSYIAIQFHF